MFIWFTSETGIYFFVVQVGRIVFLVGVGDAPSMIPCAVELTRSIVHTPHRVPRVLRTTGQYLSVMDKFFDVSPIVVGNEGQMERLDNLFHQSAFTR